MLSVSQATLAAARSGTRSVENAGVELRFAEHAAAIERAEHQIAIQAHGIDAPAPLMAGKRFTRVLRMPATFTAIAGNVGVEQSPERADNERNGRTVDAIALRTSAVGDGWLPATEAAMAHVVRLATTREAAAHAATTPRRRTPARPPTMPRTWSASSFRCGAPRVTTISCPATTSPPRGLAPLVIVRQPFAPASAGGRS